MLSFFVYQFKDVSSDFSCYERVKGEERKYDHPDLEDIIIKIDTLLNQEVL